MSDMRGLDVRVMLANARILQISEDPTFAAAMVEVRDEAIAEGYRDAAKSIFTPPVMFDDEPRLLGCWNEGQGRFFIDNEDVEYIGFDEPMMSNAISEQNIGRLICSLKENAANELAKPASVATESLGAKRNVSTHLR